MTNEEAKKAREALRKRKLEAATKREEARVEARKAAGTQVPPTAPTETPAERDSRNPLWLAKHGNDVESHETPVGETQPKEFLMDDRQYAECVESRDWEGAESRAKELERVKQKQDKEPVKYMMDGSEFCGITPEWKTWKARQDAKSNGTEVETKRNTTDDSVTHPSHYTSHPSGVECITITKHMNFCRGNAVKYLWRAGQKGDSIEKEIEDIAKAEEYCRIEKERLIALKGSK